MHVCLRGLVLTFATGIACSQEPARHNGPHVTVTFAMPRIKKCPEATQLQRAVLFTQRLERCVAEVQVLAAPEAESLAGDAFHVAIIGDALQAHAMARTSLQCEVQQRGVISRDTSAALVTAPSKQQTDELMWRLAGHAIAHLAMERLIPEHVENRLGYGWLTTGIAHRCEAMAGGITDTFLVRDVLQMPLRAWHGDWRLAVLMLLQKGQLPSIKGLLETESSDFDPAQHVLALALTNWLAGKSGPITHGDDKARMPPLAQFVVASRKGEAAAAALTRIANQCLPEIEKSFHDYLRKQPEAARGMRQQPVPQHAPHHHAAVFVYTSEPVRKRHRNIVAKALKQRHAAHTSGWQRVDGMPRLAIGPVNKAAGFWHGDDLQKRIPRTWPMVVVLEYQSKGKPTAYLDCFRRAAGSSGDKGWLLDPSVGFVPHHNAQLVTDHDKQFSYLAVPDTPTGSHVGGSEFVHRGRVTWQDGKKAAVGVLTWLASPKAKTVAKWHSIQTPLVDWHVTDRSRSAGVKRVQVVEDLERQLAVWGTKRVFRFPVIPDGLTAGRGR